MEATKIKQNLNRIVCLPDNSKARFTGAILRRNADGTFYYQAELQDLTAHHSVRICKLDDISVAED